MSLTKDPNVVIKVIDNIASSLSSIFVNVIVPSLIIPDFLSIMMQHQTRS
jgi:hypothetical protein